MPMPIMRKFQLMLAVPYLLVLVPVICWSGFYVIQDAFDAAALKSQETRVRMAGDFQKKLEAVRLHGPSGEIPFMDAYRIAEASETELIARIHKEIARESKYRQWGKRSELIAKLSPKTIPIVLLGALFLYLYVFYRSHTLRSFLWSHGYDTLGLRDAGMIYAAVGNRAFALPKADTVLVIPGYGADPEGLVHYIRNFAAYKRNK